MKRWIVNQKITRFRVDKSLVDALEVQTVY